MTIDVDAQALAPPGTYPVPQGRGRWRLTLHNRVFGTLQPTPAQTGIGEMADARGRQLQQVWNAAAMLTFTLNGDSPNALNISEMMTDVMAWRWDDQQGKDIPVFHGLVTASEDELTEDSHTVIFTCHDYLAMLARRYIAQPTPLVYTQIDQDTIAANLLAYANHPRSGNGQDVFYPGSSLPLGIVRCNPDGTPRAGLSGQLRDRTYLGGSQVSTQLDELARVIAGFDYDVLPGLGGVDSLRIFYPAQGVDRSVVTPNPGLVWGSTISQLTRTVDSQNYSNYFRSLGNNGQSDPSQSQLYADAWNSDANNVGQVPVGLWMNTDDQADVSVQSTLNDTVAGDLANYGVLVPSYTVVMRPGAYYWGVLNMGDTLPLVIQSGRLNVTTAERVLGITFDINDDGNEDVSLTLGRASLTFGKLLTKNDRAVRALTRR